MPISKLRVDVFDGDGNRYKITFEGKVTREKVLHLLDLIELLGGMPGINPEWGRIHSKQSKFEKIQSIVQKYFPIVWFESKDVQSVYEQELKEPVRLSTVSTYLSRLADRGILEKRGKSNRRRYRTIADQRALYPQAKT